MKNLNFTYIAAKNFLCFGPQGIELNLTKYRNVVLIKGYNLDRQQDEEELDIDERGIAKKKVASNGSGKSSCPEIIVYTLFGRTIKSPKKITHANVINNKSKKGLRTEVRWGDYRVVRTRKPDSLRIWESKEGDWSKLGDEEWEKEHEISVGGIPATQVLVEEKLGLNYETFVNVIVFTDNNAGSFLELDTAAKKREIVENLLSLDKFREYYDIAKKDRNTIKNNIKTLVEGYNYLLRALSSAKEYVINLKNKEKQWKLDRQAELSRLELAVQNKKKELAESDIGSALAAYHEAQERIEILNKESADLIEKNAKVQNIVSKTREELELTSTKHDELIINMGSVQQEINNGNRLVKQYEEVIKSIESLQGQPKCPTCYGPILEENYIAVLSESKIKQDTYNKEIVEFNNNLNLLRSEYNTIRQKMIKLKETLKVGDSKSAAISKQLVDARSQISSLSKIAKPDISSREQILEQQLEKLKEEVIAKRNEIDNPSPFMELVLLAEKDVDNKNKECEDKKQEVDKCELELPYYEFYVDALGEEGIRRFAINGILEALNTRIAYWLHYLMDSRIKLCFNNQFDEIIETNPPDGDPFVYHAMSGGERRMLNLAVSQAFAYIMMLNSGTSPSCAFLDEVTSNIDQIGVVGSYNMIMELAREKQVFITTHDHDLLEMLSGCDTIELQKKNGFTTLV